MVLSFVSLFSKAFAPFVLAWLVARFFVAHINTCTILLVSCERSSSSLRRSFEPFSRYLAMRRTYFVIVLADPYSTCSAMGGLGRAQAVFHRRAFFLGFHALSQARHIVFFYSPVRDNYLFGPCDPQLYLSHASLRSLPGLFIAKR